MSKRGRSAGDQLTGGSKDVNPQTFMIIGATVGNSIGQTVQPLPIPRLPTRPGKNLVIEVLSVTFIQVQYGAAVGTASNYAMTVTTQPTVPATTVAQLQDVRAIARWGKYLIVDAAPTGRAFFECTEYVDCTDAAGHGLLVATDNLYFNYSATGVASAALTSPAVEIEYRWKEVTLAEYIGIVQSQQ